MNRIGLFGAATVFTAGLQAFGGTLTVSVGPARTVAQLSAQLRQSFGVSSTPAKRRPNAISLDVGANAILLQAAGSLPGSNGTYFRSDVMLVNYRAVDQVLAIAWLVEGSDNTNSPFQFYTLPKNTAVALDDFVGQTLGKTGLGAVAIYGVDSSHNFDPNAFFDASCRIWTPQPGGSGTTSLQLPAVTLIDLVDNALGYAFGMKQTAGFHTNVGIVNLDSSPHTWIVAVNGQKGTATFTVTVPANSLQQAPIPDGDFGDLWVSFQPDRAGYFWSAYAASNDNITGDGWAAHALQP